MKFVSIPKNGSSWRKSLTYEFDVESIAPKDVEVVIINADTEEVLARQYLYGVTRSAIDIAPYVIEHVSLVPLSASSPSLHSSPSAISIVVSVNGITSNRRVFFREEFDSSVAQIMTYCRDKQEIEQGDVIRMTLFAISSIRVQVAVATSGGILPIRISFASNGMPIELVVPTVKYGDDASSIVVSVQCDSGAIHNFTYNFIPSDGQRRNVVWYNRRGGIETYSFKHTIRQSISLDTKMFDAEMFTIHRDVTSKLMYRLCTGYETAAEIDRLLEMFLSPAVYRCDAGDCSSMVLTNKEVVFDAKGNMNTLAVEVSQEWKGGAEW